MGSCNGGNCVVNGPGATCRNLCLVNFGYCDYNGRCPVNFGYCNTLLLGLA